MTKRKTLSKELCIFLSIITIGFFVCFFVLLLSDEPSNNITSLDSGWTITQNGIPTEDVCLSSYKFDQVQKGDQIILSNTLPENLPDGMMLSSVIYLSKYKILLDDTTLYSYGSNINTSKSFVGSGYFYANLPDNSAGKSISITLWVCEDNSFVSLEPIRYGDYISFSDTFFHKYIINIALSFFLVISSLVMAVLVLLSLGFTIDYLKLLPVCFFAFIIGLYGMTSSQLWSIFKLNQGNASSVEYISLFLLPVSITLIFKTFTNIKTAYKRIINLTLTVLSLFSIIIILLHFLNIAHFPSFVLFFQIYTGIAMIICLLISILSYKALSKVDRIMASGFFAFVFSCGMELLLFFLGKYYFIELFDLKINLIPIGAMIFITSIIVRAMISSTNNRTQETEQDLLNKLAYTDIQTGTFNRAQWNIDIEKLQNNLDNFSIIYFSLNGLRRINDTQGHQVGDDSLKAYANILLEAIEPIGKVYRMGGAKFSTIVREKQEKHINASLEKIKALEKDLDAKLQLDMDFSYGVASIRETEYRNFPQLYLLADQRMHAMTMERYRGSSRGQS